MGFMAVLVGVFNGLIVAVELAILGAPQWAVYGISGAVSIVVYHIHITKKG